MLRCRNAHMRPKPLSMFQAYIRSVDGIRESRDQSSSAATKRNLRDEFKRVKMQIIDCFVFHQLWRESEKAFESDIAYDPKNFTGSFWQTRNLDP